MPTPQQFISQLAKFLVKDQAHKSILLASGNELAGEWAALRNEAPLTGYPTVEEAEGAITKFLAKAPVPAEAGAGGLVVTKVIRSCADCRHLGHSGAFTPGGAKPICGLAGGKEMFPGVEEPWHWKHRIVDPKSDELPTWCPLKNGAGY